MPVEFNRVLVPLDGSSAAEASLRAIEPLIKLHACEMALLRALPEPDIPAEAGPYLEQVCSALRSRGIAARRVIRMGEPAEQILSYAGSANIDLIAMSTHGREGLTRALLGSVTEEVLRQSDVPVLICRPATEVRDWKRIVVAVDGSALAEDILPAAFGVARDLQATVHVLRASFPIVTGSGLGDFVPTFLEPEDPMPYLREICDRATWKGVAAQPVARIGRAGEEIVRYAEQCAAGLICMTTHGRTGWRRILGGSVAEYVLRHAPCPVLVRRVAAFTAPVPHDVRPA